MYVNGFMSILDRIANWISRMALLNLLWMLYTLRGLIVGGVFPATVASLGVVRKWLMEEQDIKIWETFKKGYSQEFLSSNILGWVMTGIGMILFLNYQVMVASPQEVHFIIPFAFYLTILIYLFVFIWSFPLMAHYKASVLQHMINALVIGFTKMHKSIAILVSLFSILYVSLEFPAAIVFFLFSLSSLIWFWFTLSVFKSLDDKKEVSEFEAV